MTYSSCIRHPHFEIVITIREWQVKACKTKAAPMLLNLFEKNHTRLLNGYKIAEMNGAKPEELKKMLWQRWTEDQLEVMLLNQHKRDSIREARKELESLKFIKVGENPNGNKQDRGIWIRFLAHNVNAYVNKYVEEKYPANPDLYLNGAIQKPAEAKAKKKPGPVKTTSELQAIFDNWQRIFEKPQSKLTDSKKRKINARLKEGYTKDYIIEACEGCRLSDWHIEHLEIDIAKICKDSTTLEKHHLRFEQSGKTSPQPSEIAEKDKSIYAACAEFIVQEVFKKGLKPAEVKKSFADPGKVIKNENYLAEICIQKMNVETILDEGQKTKVKKACAEFVKS